MARRDRVPLTTPIGQETFAGWALEPEVHVDLARRRVTGFMRFYGTTKKFRKSVAFDLPMPEAGIENLANAIATRLINQDPSLAGTRIVEEVADVDQDVP